MPEFHVLQHAIMTPTRCVTCQTNQSRGGFVDTGVELPGYGRVYVCADCLGDAARLVGFMTPEMGAELRDRLAEQAFTIRGLEVEVARVEGRGTWTYVPPETDPERRAMVEAESLGKPIGSYGSDPAVCPDCGGEKNPKSKRCKSCHARTLNASAAA